MYKPVFDVNKTNFEKLTVKELKKLLSKKKLNTSGTKKELIKRLEKHNKEEVKNIMDLVEVNIKKSGILDNMKKSSDSKGSSDKEASIFTKFFKYGQDRKVVIISALTGLLIGKLSLNYIKEFYPANNDIILELYKKIKKQFYERQTKYHLVPSSSTTNDAFYTTGSRASSIRPSVPSAVGPMRVRSLPSFRNNINSRSRTRRSF